MIANPHAGLLIFATDHIIHASAFEQYTSVDACAHREEINTRMKIIYRPPEGADSLWQQQAEAAFRDDHDLRVYDPA